jgi:hypothetical protein
MIRARYMPSVASLAAATGMCEKAVRNHLEAAEAAGWLIIERRPGRKSCFALVIPGTPDVADTETIDVPADIPSEPVDNPSPQATPEPVDNPPTPVRRTGVPRYDVPTVQTFVQTSTTVSGSDRRSLYVRSEDCDLSRDNRNQILEAFHFGQLYEARTDVPDLRPSARKFCAIHGPGDHPTHRCPVKAAA